MSRLVKKKDGRLMFFRVGVVGVCLLCACALAAERGSTGRIRTHGLLQLRERTLAGDFMVYICAVFGKFRLLAISY